MVRDIFVQNVEAKEELQEIEDNLQRLTIGVLDISIDDLPRCYPSYYRGVETF